MFENETPLWLNLSFSLSYDKTSLAQSRFQALSIAPDMATPLMQFKTSCVHAGWRLLAAWHRDVSKCAPEVQGSLHVHCGCGTPDLVRTSPMT